MIKKTVSVIVPVYNAQDIIAKCLDAVLNQSYPADEIIFVDDGSTDHTAERIKSCQSKTVRYVYQKNAGPASARNAGARLAAGEILFFTDADCLPRENWIETSIRHFSDESLAVVAGSYGIMNPESLLARCIHAEILYRHHNLMPDEPKFFGGFNFAIRKNAFDAVGGFNEGFRRASGEDNNLSYKISAKGFRIFFEKQSLVDHKHTEKRGKYLREQFCHGFWRVKMYCYHPHMMKGDGYTYWKDILELPLSVVSLCFLFLSWIKAGMFTTAVFVMGGHFFMEWLIARRMLRGQKESLFFSGVMYLRSFARMFGFFGGLLMVWKNGDQQSEKR